ncbi:MAG: 2OG-Fe(II) oxygenase [Hydrogenophaga sp.]|nr:2OG-Fe(II) oxygenase [Hydrogenophaga sp.]
MTQTVTPELRQWIIEQSTAGCMPEAVLEAMVNAGWQPDVAEAALEQTLRDHLKQLGASRVAAPAPGVAREMAVARAPEIPLGGSPRRLDAGDRMVDVIVSISMPRVVVLGGLLSDEECDALIEASRPRLARSLTVQTVTGGEELNPDRTSSGMFFGRGENDLVKRIEARIARLVNWPVENGEGIQVLNYKTGAEYKPHYDYFDPDEPGTPTILKRGGQRVGTVVMYLNEPARGGGTTFPDIGLEVAPVRGNAVFFSYNRPHPGTMTLHGGAPVIEGEKWVATKWMRERVFE